MYYLTAPYTRWTKSSKQLSDRLPQRAQFLTWLHQQSGEEPGEVVDQDVGRADPVRRPERPQPVYELADVDVGVVDLILGESWL